MCEVLDRVENKGRLEGELKGKQETAINLHNMGIPKIRNAYLNF